jgi:hypothetical protein
MLQGSAASSELDHSDDGWPIAVAILARQALEQSLEDLWAVRVPGLERASMRAQLLCLVQHIDPGLAHETASVWGSLSGACHHHAYALPPTAGELESWLDSAERFVRESDRLIQLRNARTKAD